MNAIAPKMPIMALRLCLIICASLIKSNRGKKRLIIKPKTAVKTCALNGKRRNPKN